MIESAYERAKKILSENANGHKKLANLLLEREVIFSEDLEHIFGPRQWGKPKEEPQSEAPKSEPDKANSEEAANS